MASKEVGKDSVGGEWIVSQLDTVNRNLRPMEIEERFFVPTDAKDLAIRHANSEQLESYLNASAAAKNNVDLGERFQETQEEVGGRATCRGALPAALNLRGAPRAD